MRICACGMVALCEDRSSPDGSRTKNKRTSASRLRALSFASDAKETRHEAAYFGTEDGHGVVAAKLRNATDKVDPAESIFAVLADVVEDDERSVGPATQHRLL